MNQPLPPDVLAALARRDKIEAIRLVRLHTGLGLADAKQAVEQGFTVSVTPVQPGALPANSFADAFPPEVSAALVRGNKIEAIKLLRAARGMGLKDAKDAIDAAESGGPQQALAPGEMRRSNSAGVWLAVVAALLAAALWMWLARK